MDGWKKSQTKNYTVCHNSAKTNDAAKSRTKETASFWTHMQNERGQEDQSPNVLNNGGVNKKGRPHKEWCDDIEEWCGSSLQDLSYRTVNRKEWQKTVEMTLYTNGC